MTPPKATQAGHSAPAGDTLAAVLPCAVQTLQVRADFLKAATARRLNTPAFGLQARQRDGTQGDPNLIRVGYTCTKKVGNAIARNRAKRRLREIARKILPLRGHAGWDYVLIGRPQTTADRPFAALLQDFESALARIHAPRRSQ